MKLISCVFISGPSLIWVGIMGLIIIYLYGLIGFAFMRSMFKKEEQMFCSSLLECTVTVFRYGIIGDIDGVRYQLIYFPQFSVMFRPPNPTFFLFLSFLLIIKQQSVMLIDAIWLLQLVIPLIHALSDPSQACTGIRTWFPSMRGRRLTNWAITPQPHSQQYTSLATYSNLVSLFHISKLYLIHTKHDH